MDTGTGRKTMLLGAICCAAGVACNAVTYSGTASTEELTYVLAWGAIIFGAIQIVRGAANRGPSNQQ
ncbi:MAG: hypothetical protein IPM54_03450 [Polyangiaceae bacterium]|nr:hypothetical protein [Polyangiaceae bacterium]